MKLVSRFLASSMLAIVAASVPRSASACGGTFCDSGPTAMPVDQTGENIIFVMGDGIVEAHVQIQYQGDPAKFAWIVPMQQVPEVTVGSEQLFDNIMAATRPVYGFNTVAAQCGGQNQRGVLSADNGSFGGSGGTSAGPGLNVTQQTVGSFEIATLQGGTVDEIVQWLSMNGYEQIPDAPAILQRYVDKNFVFVAVKLTAGAGLDEIHPLVFSYPGGEPCVPLELTAVAAVPDMGVRTYFLGAHRVVPANYRHVLVNPLKIDWLNTGSNYTSVISAAVDSDGADGQAFVTEYAGTSSKVQRGFVNPSWNPSVLATTTPDNVIQELGIEGLLSCQNNFCQYFHPLILPILQNYLPRPAGRTEDEYYSCVNCFTAEADLTKWNAAAFAQDVDSRIVQPAQHAEDLLAKYTYLTRMFTLISPDEMTLDPIFREYADLPDVPLPTMATRQMRCDGSSIFELPDGEKVFIEANGTWPTFNEMSPAVEVDSYGTSGTAVLVADNSSKIDSQLEDYNAAHGFGDSGCGCAVPGRRTPAGPALFALGAALAAIAVARRRR